MVDHTKPLRELRARSAYDRSHACTLEQRAIHDERIAALDAAIAALNPAPPTSAEGWRCFHCDEAFTDRDTAAVHFGTHEHQRPACLIDAAEYRRMETKEARYAEEDADCHRAMHGMRNEHTQALQRAEEAGYAKGLRDSGKCPCATPADESGADWKVALMADMHEYAEVLAEERDATPTAEPRAAAQEDGTIVMLRSMLYYQKADTLAARALEDAIARLQPSGASEDAARALSWALPLAEMAIEHHRQERIEAGHTDIRGTYKQSGETWVGIHQQEVDAIEFARDAARRARGEA